MPVPQPHATSPPIGPKVNPDDFQSGTVMMSAYAEKPVIVIGMSPGTTMLLKVLWASGWIGSAWIHDLHGLDEDLDD